MTDAVFYDHINVMSTKTATAGGIRELSSVRVD